MVALGILAVLTTLAVPSYRDFVLDMPTNSEANEFVTALAFARAEAIKPDGPVTV